MPGNGSLYLIHFSRPVGTPGGHQAQHYLGWASDVERRYTEHCYGAGAAITRWCVLHGINMEIVAVWPGSRDDERIAKRQGHYSRRCPVCRARALARHNAWQRERRARHGR